MAKRVDSSTTAQPTEGVVTADSQPRAEFKQAHQGTVIVPASSSFGTTGGPRAASVMVRATPGQVVRVPYDAERESLRRENLRQNGLIEEVRPSTADTR